MNAPDARAPWWGWPLLLVLLPLALLVAISWLLVACGLLLIVWTRWLPRGRSALVVYSNSPIWREYFEEHVLPAVGNRAAVLNWSDRSQWRLSVPVALFRAFGGRREFNPMAIVLGPWSWPRTFRFYRAFQSFKHGNPDEVERLRRELLAAMDIRGPFEPGT